jgi:hypothetical protein
LQALADSKWLRYVAIPAGAFAALAIFGLIISSGPLEFTIVIPWSFAFAFLVAVYGWWSKRLGHSVSSRTSDLSIACWFASGALAIGFYLLSFHELLLDVLLQIAVFVPFVLGFLYIISEFARIAQSEELWPTKGPRIMLVGVLFLLAFSFGISSISNMAKEALNLQYSSSLSFSWIRRLGELAGTIVSGAGLLLVRDLRVHPKHEEVVAVPKTKQLLRQRIQGTGIGIAIIGIALGYYSTIALEGFFILLIGISLYLTGWLAEQLPKLSHSVEAVT